MKLRKIIKDILTGVDNESFDSGRVLCLLSFIVYFSLAIISAADGHSWPAMEFSGGVSTMAVGFGINLRLKRKTEPEP